MGLMTERAVAILEGRMDDVPRLLELLLVAAQAELIRFGLEQPAGVGCMRAVAGIAIAGFDGHMRAGLAQPNFGLVVTLSAEIEAVGRSQLLEIRAVRTMAIQAVTILEGRMQIFHSQFAGLLLVATQTEASTIAGDERLRREPMGPVAKRAISLGGVVPRQQVQFADDLLVAFEAEPARRALHQMLVSRSVRRVAVETEAFRHRLVNARGYYLALIMAIQTKRIRIADVQGEGRVRVGALVAHFAIAFPGGIVHGHGQEGLVV